MLVQFFFDLRRAHVPVTLREYLTLLEALSMVQRYPASSQDWPRLPLR